MAGGFTRRGWLEGAAAVGGVLAATAAPANPLTRVQAARHPGWVFGRMTGAAALTEALLLEGTGCVYGIPGAQGNELWDTFKQKHLPYLLVTHEFSAAVMADAYGRTTGRPGVMCVVPGPGVTNSLTGLGEALLDSSPVVAIVGDVANGEKYRPFQVHALPNADILRPVCKAVYPVGTVEQIPALVRQAFVTAMSGEPGPVAVVVPYNLLIEAADFRCPPPAVPALPFDDAAFGRAHAILRDPHQRVGIYAGAGCMNHPAELTAVAELLQAPVATSVSGKGVINEAHPLAVGWGYGPHASNVAEAAFEGERAHPLRTGVTTVLAVGVKYSEVSTGYYGNPQPRHLIHVDANHCNLGRAVRADVCVHADAGIFLGRLLACAEGLRRAPDQRLTERIRRLKADTDRTLCSVPAAKCGSDPLAVVAALRRVLPEDALLFTDVSVTEHLAAEFYRVCRPRTYFNPVDNQAMGWSIPAAIGAAKVHHGRRVATLTGDGCMLMTAVEMSTAAREGLPVTFVVLDDHAYQYMQMLQMPAYRRTTATRLAAIDYRALAQAFGLGYVEVLAQAELEPKLRAAVCDPRPVLVRVATDYGERKVRWVEAVRDRYTNDLSAAQKARFLTRISARTLNLRPEVND